MDEDDLPELKTPEAVAGFLALKHANGMSFKDVLDLHTQILVRIGTDYIKTWDDPEDFPETSTAGYAQHWLVQGGYFALGYLEDDYEWYDFPTLDGPDADA